MKNYHDIKEKEFWVTKDYSEERFNRYLRFHKNLKGLYSELFFWSISIVPFIIVSVFLLQESYLFFLIVHFLFWKFKGQKMYHKACDKDIEELELTIQVLEDIQKERNEK
jgi:archaellum biogenesis protein FlaJ (TadC family)